MAHPEKMMDMQCNGTRDEEEACNGTRDEEEKCNETRDEEEAYNGTRDEEEACNPFSSYCRTYNPVTHRTPPLPSPTINTTYNSSSCKFRQSYLLLAEVWMIYSPVNAIIKDVHFVSLSTTALSCCRLSCSEPQSVGNINWTLNNRWLAESDVFLWSTALL